MKWKTIGFSVTEDEEKQIKEFTEDYANINSIKEPYTINKHIRNVVFSCIKNFYKKHPK